MQPVTTRDLLSKSICFKFLFGITILFTLVAMILGIVSTNVTCSKSSGYSVCSEYFTYTTTSCTEYGVDYCCGAYYDVNMPYYSCQYNGLYCYKSPTSSNRSFCMGLVVTARSFMGISFIFFIILLATLCHFRRVKSKLARGPHQQPLIFSSPEEFIKYQSAQNNQSLNNLPNPHSANNTYSLNGQYANYNQVPIQNGNNPPKYKVTLTHNREILDAADN